MDRVTQQLGFREGEHLELAYAIHAVLAEQYEENMNYVGYVTAFLTDQGFTPIEMYRIYSTWVHSGVHACYAEANDAPRGTFLPWTCEDVDYVGVPPRELEVHKTGG
jgi:citrate synthase